LKPSGFSLDKKASMQQEAGEFVTSRIACHEFMMRRRSMPRCRFQNPLDVGKVKGRLRHAQGAPARGHGCSQLPSYGFTLLAQGSRGACVVRGHFFPHNCPQGRAVLPRGV
jgi:hypothetical protein